MIGSLMTLSLPKTKIRVLLLDEVESNHTRFLHARLRIRQRRFFERLHRFRFDMSMNVNNEHIRRIR